jgi:hypothetical protein
MSQDMRGTGVRVADMKEEPFGEPLTTVLLESSHTRSQSIQLAQGHLTRLA